MVALNFKKQFEEAIVSGRKRQTVRAPRKRPIRAGQGLQLYVGLRTRGARKIADAVCTSTHPISILPGGRMRVAGAWITKEMKEQFARSDGFDSLDEFLAFFDLPFEGRVILWRLA